MGIIIDVAVVEDNARFSPTEDNKRQIGVEELKRQVRYDVISRTTEVILTYTEEEYNSGGV